MKGNNWKLKGLSLLVAGWLVGIPAAYAQPPTVTPPPQPVPEGNLLTITAMIGAGLYLIWLKGRRPN